MERDNEAIELQFGTGQPPVGHYRRARRLFKEFKVCLRKTAPVLFTVTTGMCVTACQSGGGGRSGHIYKKKKSE